MSLGQRAARAAMLAEALAARVAAPAPQPTPKHDMFAVLGRPERNDLGTRLDAAA